MIFEQNKMLPHDFETKNSMYLFAVYLYNFSICFVSFCFVFCWACCDDLKTKITVLLFYFVIQIYSFQNKLGCSEGYSFLFKSFFKTEKFIFLYLTCC